MINHRQYYREEALETEANECPATLPIIIVYCFIIILHECLLHDSLENEHGSQCSRAD